MPGSSDFEQATEFYVRVSRDNGSSRLFWFTRLEQALSAATYARSKGRCMVEVGMDTLTERERSRS